MGKFKELLIIICTLALLLGDCFAAGADPAAAAQDVQALLGYYQSEGENIIIRERSGRMELLYGVTQGDYAFDKSNVFQMEKSRYDEYTIIASNPRDYRFTMPLKFERDKEGRGITCVIEKRRFTRIFLPGENGGQAFVLPLPQSLNLIRSAALVAEMPKQNENLLSAELVDVVILDPAIKTKMIYASEENATKSRIYESDKAFLGRQAAEALNRVNKKIAAYGYGLIVWDAYRPWYITKMFHDILPDDRKDLLEPPETGSPHNRGMSVDVTLYSLATGLEVQMGSGFDEPSMRAHSRFQGGGELERYRRGILTLLMVGEGFSGIEHEWWHFDYTGFEKYRLLNTPFEQIAGGVK